MRMLAVNSGGAKRINTPHYNTLWCNNQSVDNYTLVMETK